MLAKRPAGDKVSAAVSPPVPPPAFTRAPDKLQNGGGHP